MALYDPWELPGAILAEKCAAIGITPRQGRNILRLAEHLESLPDDYQDFRMDVYGGWLSRDEKEDCGTAACALGHGPRVGLRRRKGEAWPDYGRRVTGFRPDTEDNKYFYCFSSFWARRGHDNTPQGAAARLRYVLEGGVIPDITSDEFWSEDRYATYRRSNRVLAS